jgi:chromosome partitioning protein
MQGRPHLPTIALVNPKGGAGKTTVALVLGTALADRGASVTLVDADPNQPLTTWSKLGAVPGGLDVATDVNEDTIIDTIEAAAARSAFVIVDLEGTASVMVNYAISRANLALIPLQGSQLDASQATRAIKLIRKVNRGFGARVDYALVFTRTSKAIRPRTFKHIESELQQHEIPVLATHLFEREAYKALFSVGGTLNTLTPKEASNLDAARANAASLVKDVIERLRHAAREAA